MIHWAQGTVVDILAQDPGVQHVMVQRAGNANEKAVHYTDFQPPLQVGDAVVLNTTAVDLKLGTGGQHFVTWKMDEVDQTSPLNGHIMKLRYTPWQVAVLAAEEQDSPYHNVLKEANELDGMPVLVGELHSMLPILTASLRYLGEQQGRNIRIAYVMTDGAALPLKFSRHVKQLNQLKWLVGTITVGHAFGGDLEAVNIYSGLLTAKHVLNADITIVLMGPGIVGTGTRYGFSGVEQGQVVNAAHALHGKPIVVPRISFAEDRSRHEGISHHTMTVLEHVIMRPTPVAVPELPKREWEIVIERQLGQIKETRHQFTHVPLRVPDLKARLAIYPGKIVSMGRDVQADLAFFLGVSSAADVACNVFNTWGEGRATDESTTPEA